MNVGVKRGGAQDEEAMSTGIKHARSESGGRSGMQPRRTPTPVGLSEGELHVIDNQLVLRLPVSDAEVYRGKMVTPRLSLQASNTLPDDTLNRLAYNTYDSLLADTAADGVIPIHAEMQHMLETGEIGRAHV